MNLEQEGKLRYKILTNFVNAYKDKMFLSNSPGKEAGGSDIMTLEDLKAQTQAERSDIKLDFE
jgi:phosphotransferase system HPr-like phosphotransfer protein